MWTVVIAQEVVEQPGIGLDFGLGLMEVIQGLMRFFYRSEGPLDFTFGAGRGAAAIMAAGQMRLYLNTQIAHDLLKHVTLRHWPVIGIEVSRTPTKREPLVSL